MQRVEFENALKRVAEFGCAENVDWMFDQFGTGVSQKGLDDAVGAGAGARSYASGQNAAGACLCAVMRTCSHGAASRRSAYSRIN